jgi:DNA-binding XRE family transcriptional regulator
MKDPESDKRLPNYIRIHRRRAGLSQRELSQTLGFRVESVARHEQFQATPDLFIAIGYEIIFRVPVSELFAGLRDEISSRIEAELLQLEEQLGRRSVRDRDATMTARKIAWLSERRNTNYESVP